MSIYDVKASSLTRPIKHERMVIAPENCILDNLHDPTMKWLMVSGNGQKGPAPRLPGGADHRRVIRLAVFLRPGEEPPIGLVKEQAEVTHGKDLGDRLAEFLFDECR
jgi:hypothetical protein